MAAGAAARAGAAGYGAAAGADQSGVGERRCLYDVGEGEPGQGSINFASVPIRTIVEMALAMNATTVYVAHNHPSGVAFPSVEDRACTLRLATALYAVDITLADHFVIAEDDYVSMLQSNYYCPKDVTDYFG